MKRCSTCGCENEVNSSHCTECGGTEFRAGEPAEALAPIDPNEVYRTLTRFPTLVEADALATRLQAAGIEVFMPDEYLMQTTGAMNPSAFGFVRVQVRSEDFVAAKEVMQAAGSSTEPPSLAKPPVLE